MQTAATGGAGAAEYLELLQAWENGECQEAGGEETSSEETWPTAQDL